MIITRTIEKKKRKIKEKTTKPFLNTEANPSPEISMQVVHTSSNSKKNEKKFKQPEIPTITPFAKPKHKVHSNGKRKKNEEQESEHLLAQTIQPDIRNEKREEEEEQSSEIAGGH